MDCVTAKGASKVSASHSARRSHQSPASYTASSTHIPSIWASQPLEMSAGGLLDGKSDSLTMEMYRDIVRNMSVDLIQINKARTRPQSHKTLEYVNVVNHDHL